MGVIFKHEIKEINTSTPTLKLSASVGADSFFYAIENEHAELMEVCGNALDAHQAFFDDGVIFLDALMAEHPSLFETFSKVRIYFEQPMLVLQSSNDHSDQYNRAYFESKTHLAKGDFVHAQSLPTLNAKALFNLPVKVKQDLGLYFDDIEVGHTFASMLDWYASNAKWRQIGHAIQLHRGRNTLFISAWQNGFLARYEMWPYQTVTDTSFYLLKMLKNLGWNANASFFHFSQVDPVEKSNDLVDEDPLLSKLKARLINLDSMGWKNLADDHFSLFTISRCGS